MRGIARSLAIAGLLASAASGAHLAMPQLAVACSCAAPLPGVADFDGPDQAVVVGQVGAEVGGGLFAFAVERWFHGGTEPTIRMRSATERLPDGSFVTNTCGVELVPGTRLVVAAHRADDVVTPSACSPHAEVESMEGQQMLAGAAARFGPGIVPNETSPPDEAPLDLATIAIALVLGTVGLVVAVAVVGVLRRGPREGPA